MSEEVQLRPQRPDYSKLYEEKRKEALVNALRFDYAKDKPQEETTNPILSETEKVEIAVAKVIDAFCASPEVKILAYE